VVDVLRKEVEVLNVLELLLMMPSGLLPFAFVGFEFRSPCWNSPGRGANRNGVKMQCVVQELLLLVYEMFSQLD
jgi:hypothetical protein